MRKQLRQFSRKEHTENHAVVVADFENEDMAREFMREIRKVARKARHLSGNNFSYEMYLNYKYSNETKSITGRIIPRNKYVFEEKIKEETIL